MYTKVIIVIGLAVFTEVKACEWRSRHLPNTIFEIPIEKNVSFSQLVVLINEKYDVLS